MYAIGLLMLAVLGASDHSPALSTTLPGGTWEASGSLGAREIGTAVGPAFGWDADLSFGVTDNLQLNIVWPALVVRVGNPGDTEYFLGAGTWGVENSVQFAALTYELGAEVGVRTWYGRAVAVAITLDASNTRPWGVTPPTPFFTGVAAAGVTLGLGDLVTVHLAIAATNTSDVLATFWQTAPRLGAGSVQRVGLRRLPLVEVHLLPMLNADLFAAAWAPFPYQGPLAVEALAGATVQLP